MYYFWVLLVWVATALGDNCDKNGVLIYEDLGCTPENPQNGSCPEKFNCPNLVSNATTCAFGGKLYNDRESVDGSQSRLSCNFGCHCDPDSKSNPRSKFTCAVGGCPEQTGHHPPPNCYSKYTLDGCCAGGNLCFGKDDIATCEFSGKTFQEGNQIWPENTCWLCVCQKGFNGKLEAPYCRRQRCGAQLRVGKFIEQKCAPIYSSKSALCCPENWACADGTEKIEGEITSENLECQFGEQILKKGQTLEKTNVPALYFGEPIEKVKCECSLPPLLTCHTV